MQADLNRLSSLAALTLFMGTVGTVVSHAEDLQPGEVLKRQGLRRSAGSTWVFVAEAVILKDVRTARDLSIQLKSAQAQQQALEMGNQNPQVFIDNYRQRIDWLDQRISAYDQELANLGPSGGNQAANVYHNLLVQERNVIVGEQRRLGTLINDLAGQRGQFQELKQQFSAEVARLRESSMKTVSRLRKSVDEINVKYAELNGQEEVSKALKELSASSKTKQKLGPSKDLASAIKWLERFEGSFLTKVGPDDPVTTLGKGKGTRKKRGSR